MTAEPVAATRHTATYPGRADQLRHVRRAVASHLTGCAAANDAVLVASELAANAILHSRSRAAHFTIRTELHPDHVRIEADTFDRATQHVRENHIEVRESGIKLYPALLRYTWPSELDLMAKITGCRVRDRWAVWD